MNKDNEKQVMIRCFACDRELRKRPRYLVDTRDNQHVWVGPECYKKIMRAGDTGYGGPLWKTGYVKLYPILTKKKEK